MTDECPTHGTDCPGHLHAEILGGKAYWSLPGTPIEDWLTDGGEPPAGSGWTQIGYVSEDGVDFGPAADGADLDQVLRATARKLTVSMTFNARDVDPKTYALLTGSTIPPPWKKQPPPPYPIDLEKVRWLTKEPPLTRMEREEIPWPDADHMFPLYVQRWQAAILDQMMERRRDDTR